jgi:dimethylaniline monooxygenase (N-oxide forming)
LRAWTEAASARIVGCMTATRTPHDGARRIAVVGAGFAGLASAKVLGRFGHAVTVFERCPDVGGVWSATHRYPGLRVQNVRSTYAFSDFDWPRGVPEWPTAEQVHDYLEGYVEYFGLGESLRLETEVVAAELDETTGTWTLRTADVEGGVPAEVFDHLVVANGIFSDPLVPAFAGADEHAAAGGRVLHTSQLTSLDEARDRHVVVVGYGKSACDVAEAVSDVAASTTVVARRLLWKMPRRVAGALNYKYLLLTRLGEALFPYPESRPSRLLHGPAGMAARMLGSVQAVATRQDRLRGLGLVPSGTLAEVATSRGCLTTNGFFAKVRRGRIAVRRDEEIERLLMGEDDRRPVAKLKDGTRLPADLILCGTGFRQRVPFLGDDLQGRLTDEHGDFALFRHVLPIDVPALTFAGYNSSFFCPLSAEVAAYWTASLLAGELRLPEPKAMRAHVRARLAWMRERTGGRHARGTNLIPFSMHNIDELLADMGLASSPAARLREWLLPIDPRTYRSLERRLLARRAPGVAPVPMTAS